MRGYHLYFCKEGHPQVHRDRDAHEWRNCLYSAHGKFADVSLRPATDAETALWLLLGHQWDCTPLEDP